MRTIHIYTSFSSLPVLEDGGIPQRKIWKRHCTSLRMSCKNGPLLAPDVVIFLSSRSILGEGVSFYVRQRPHPPQLLDRLWLLRFPL